MNSVTFVLIPQHKIYYGYADPVNPGPGPNPELSRTIIVNFQNSVSGQQESNYNPWELTFNGRTYNIGNNQIPSTMPIDITANVLTFGLFNFNGEEGSKLTIVDSNNNVIDEKTSDGTYYIVIPSNVFNITIIRNLVTNQYQGGDTVDIDPDPEPEPPVITRSIRVNFQNNVTGDGEDNDPWVIEFNRSDLGYQFGANSIPSSRNVLITNNTLTIGLSNFNGEDGSKLTIVDSNNNTLIEKTNNDQFDITIPSNVNEITLIRELVTASETPSPEPTPPDPIPPVIIKTITVTYDNNVEGTGTDNSTPWGVTLNNGTMDNISANQIPNSKTVQITNNTLTLGLSSFNGSNGSKLIIINSNNNATIDAKTENGTYSIAIPSGVFNITIIRYLVLESGSNNSRSVQITYNNNVQGNGTDTAWGVILNNGQVDEIKTGQIPNSRYIQIINNVLIIELRKNNFNGGTGSKLVLKDQNGHVIIEITNEGVYRIVLPVNVTNITIERNINLTDEVEIINDGPNTGGGGEGGQGQTEFEGGTGTGEGEGGDNPSPSGESENGYWALSSGNGSVTGKHFAPEFNDYDEQWTVSYKYENGEWYEKIDGEDSEWQSSGDILCNITDDSGFITLTYRPNGKTNHGYNSVYLDCESSGNTWNEEYQDYESDFMDYFGHVSVSAVWISVPVQE